MNKNLIWIGNDHGGYELKLSIIEYLKKNNLEYVDIGSHSTDIVRYPYYAAKVAGAISRGEAMRGILICSTGIGMSIIANKYKGVRASLCTSTYMGRMTRAHNDSNVLCLGGKITGTFEAIDILEAWLNTEYEGGRHDISLGLISEVEKVLCSAQEWKPVKLILDTDMLTDCDDAAALAMLHAMADDGEVEILSTMVSSRYPIFAPVVDAINTYYNRPNIPVGAPKNGSGAFRDDSSFLDKVAKEFPHSLASNDDAMDAVELYRRVLASQEDQSVKLLTIGYMSNLENLLKSKPDDISPLSGIELVESKVMEWVCMGGNFPVDSAEDNVNFTRDSSAAVYVIRNWTGKITFVGREIGHNIYVGNALKNTPESSPVRRSYQLHRDRFNLGHWNHHTADPSAVLYAVRGLRDYWTIENEGYIDIKDDCSFEWIKNPGSKQGYLIQKLDRTEMGRIMEELMVRLPK